MIWIIELIVYVGMLFINFQLISKDRATISQRYHALLDQKWDYVVMIVFFILQVLFYAIWSPVIGIGEIIACIVRNIIAGHWFWHED